MAKTDTHRDLHQPPDELWSQTKNHLACWVYRSYAASWASVLMGCVTVHITLHYL